MSSWYFHGAISRAETEEVLKKAGKDGSFLVRNSASMPSSYSLCILFDGRVHQYRIIKDRDGLLFIQAEKGVEERKYPQLDGLIEDYLARGGHNGLITALKFALPCSKGGDWYELEQSVYNDDPLTNHFKLQLQRLDLSILDGNLVSQLRRFVDCRLLHDAVRCKENGKEGLLFFRDMLRDSTGALIREVRYFELLLELISELFCGTKASQLNKRSLDGADIFELLERVSSLKSQYEKLEDKVCDALRSFLVTTPEDPGGGAAGEAGAEDGAAATASSAGSGYCPQAFQLSFEGGGGGGGRGRMPHSNITKPLFEVKSSSGKLSQKDLFLMVDPGQGRLHLIKPNQISLEQTTFIPHDKILRVIKSTTNKCLLQLKCEHRKKDSFLFRDFRERELFCQLVTHMRRTHNRELDPDTLSVFAGTWNMAGEWPRWSLLPWLKSIGSGKSRDPALSSIPHDLYALATQESSDTERKWEEHVKKELELAFGIEYQTLHHSSFWGLRLLLLIRPEYKKKVTDLRSCTLRTGFTNNLGARGVLAAAFRFNATSFAFVNCHLPTWPARQAKRDPLLKEMLKGLNLGDRTLPDCDLTHEFDHVIWMGDFSCRLEGNLGSIEQKLRLRSFGSLLSRDQLSAARKAREAFQQFAEEEILFPPTYRYEKHKRDQWATCVPRGPANQRVHLPSWSDRVLTCSRPHLFIQCTSYGCQMDQDVSDHKPVFASYYVGVVCEYAPKNPIAAAGLHCSNGLRFEFVTAKLRGASARHSYQLNFYGPCIGGRFDSAPNTHFLPSEDLERTGCWKAAPDAYICPVWQNVLPPLELSTEDPEYLEDAHLLVRVRNIDTDETCGACIVSLRPLISDMPQAVDVNLTLYGEERGCLLSHCNITGSTDQWRSSLARRRSKTRTYELVAMDTDTLRPGEGDGAIAEDDDEGDEEPVPAPGAASSAAAASAGGDGRSPSSSSSTSSTDSASTVTRDTPLSAASAGAAAPAAAVPHLSRAGGASDLYLYPKKTTSSQVVKPAAMRSATAAAGDAAASASGQAPPPLPPKRRGRTLSSHSQRSGGSSGGSGGGSGSASSSPQVPRRQMSAGATASAITVGATGSLERSAAAPASLPIEYETLSRPATLAEWLACLQLGQYTQLFEAAGVATVSQAQGLTDAELQRIGVQDRAHRERLASYTCLPAALKAAAGKNS
ncbi:hypothetical protein BOX15_Mlig016651g2 [Macrostomum lignano]|uniref:phosphatidylinositol-3,4,5-trisphosphate 5-phosphatase n=1 Tax=Macrostomum lignano TaxID=282301 RepID=A0A267GQS3_9PLAT|nr:hypothetical protein BOX15_Mlig016651g2 [Macrostomum lignano]